MNQQHPSVTQGKPGGMWSTLTSGTTTSSTSTSTTTHHVTTQQPAPQYGMQTFNALRATTADANSASYQQSTPLVYDASNFGHSGLSPRERLDQVKMRLVALQEQIGKPEERQHNQQAIQFVFETLASLDGISNRSVLQPQVHAKLQQMCDQCDQPRKRKEWQRFIDLLKQEIVQPLEALPVTNIVRHGTPAHDMRHQWELAQDRMQARDYPSAVRHLEAMGEILTELIDLNDGGAGHEPLLNAILTATKACLDGQVQLDHVADLHAQINQLPDDATTTAATTLQAPAAASARPVAQPQTTAGDADIQWPDGDALPWLLAELQSPAVSNMTYAEKLNHLGNLADTSADAMRPVVALSNATPQFQRAVAALCRNVQQPTQVDPTAFADNPHLMRLHAYQQSMETRRDNNGVIPWPSIHEAKSADKEVTRWRTLIWGIRIKKIVSLQREVEQAGPAGLLLSSVQGRLNEVSKTVRMNSGTFIRWNDLQGNERIGLRQPALSHEQIRELILKKIETLPLAVFGSADMNGLGLGINASTVNINLARLCKQANPRIRSAGPTGMYERVPDTAQPPAKRPRLA